MFAIRLRPALHLRLHHRDTVHVIEAAIFLSGLLVAGYLGLSLHRWLWTQAELKTCRVAMDQVAGSIQAMRLRALATRQPAQLRIDAARRQLQVVMLRGRPGDETVSLEHLWWLPEHVEISEAPSMVTAQPNGTLSASTIVVIIPAYQRLFRVTTSTNGRVTLDEESLL